MFKSYPFTKLFLLSILFMILGWILNEMMWAGHLPFKFNETTLFIGFIVMYIGLV